MKKDDKDKKSNKYKKVSVKKKNLYKTQKSKTDNTRVSKKPIQKANFKLGAEDRAMANKVADKRFKKFYGLGSRLSNKKDAYKKLSDEGWLHTGGGNFYHRKGIEKDIKDVLDKNKKNKNKKNKN